MLPSEQWIVREIERVQDFAARLRSKFNAGAPPEELLIYAGNLTALVESLKTSLPKDMPAPTSLNRHLAWLDKRLREGKPDQCESDIVDICDRDLPALMQAFQEWQKNNTYRDQELFEKVAPLMDTQQYDSAVRKSFVILKERLVSRFGLAKNLDGVRLATAAFGPTGPLAGKVEAKELDALRTLTTAMYATFRNRYGHHDLKATSFETEAVVVMVNWLLKAIDGY
jgi:hypothetical protein